MLDEKQFTDILSRGRSRFFKIDRSMKDINSFFPNLSPKISTFQRSSRVDIKLGWLCKYHFSGNTTRSHKGYLFLFYPTVQIIFVFSKSTDAHPRQDVLPDKFWREYIYRNKNGRLNCYDWKCIWVLVSIRSSIRLF